MKLLDVEEASSSELGVGCPLFVWWKRWKKVRGDDKIFLKARDSEEKPAFCAVVD